jgi:hypothetical protein
VFVCGSGASAALPSASYSTCAPHLWLSTQMGATMTTWLLLGAAPALSRAANELRALLSLDLSGHKQ